MLSAGKSTMRVQVKARTNPQMAQAKARANPQNGFLKHRGQVQVNARAQPEGTCQLGYFRTFRA
jgi:hypothetical protein